MQWSRTHRLNIVRRELALTLQYCVYPIYSIKNQLHDVNVSGWWVLIPLLPIIGYFKILILLASDTYPDMNRWGVPAKNPS